MEIQTFCLCKTIEETTPGGATYDVRTIALRTFYALDGIFPLRFSMPCYMLLRRDTRGPEVPVSLRFTLIDQDGKPAGEPNNSRISGTFPAGQKFCTLVGAITFSFPAPGDYRLDIIADEEVHAFTYQYNIEITR